MTEPAQGFIAQEQAYKRKGVLSPRTMAGGAWTSELFAFVNATGATTDFAVVAAVAGSRIRVLSYALSAVVTGVSSGTFTSKPGGAGTAISPLISLPLNGFVSEDSAIGLFQTAVGEGLSITTGLNIVGVRVTYILVD